MLKKWMIILCISVPHSGFMQGLVINEVSNGTSGSKEYFEFIVDGTPCTTVDLRGWIFDDNNGDFSCGPCTAAGIATGHYRFAALPVWSAVPVGSLIVIYNSTDVDAFMPASDPSDLIVPNGIYIVPDNHPNIEYSSCAGVPSAATACPGPCTGNSGYATGCYASGVANWGAKNGLRNAGDVGQSRRPNGTYFHGFAWGVPANNMTGGPDGLIIAIDGTNISFGLTNGVNNNYRNVANWGSVTAASGTPGAGNTANNTVWINSLACPLPVSLTSFSITCESTHTSIRWSSSSEINNSHFNIERSEDGHSYHIVGTVAGAGNSNSLIEYEFIDYTATGSNYYYRITQTDFDGTTKNYQPAFSKCDGTIGLETVANVIGGSSNSILIKVFSPMNQDATVTITDILGRNLHQKNIILSKGYEDISLVSELLSNGIYFIRLNGQAFDISLKYWIVK